MPALRTALIVAGLSTALAAQAARTSWPISQAPPELRAAVSRADLVIVTLQDAVLRQLHDELARGGQAHAMNVAHLDVSNAIQRVGREEGIAAGMTSDRLRNPTNAPRAWAAPFVRQHAGQASRTVEGFVVNLGDRTGVLRPIAERPVCAGCHGPVLAPGVSSALQERYPADRARGFAEGEIRGWFWVEIPRARR